MAHIIPITDANDPRLDVFARLTEAQLRNKLEPEKGVFIAESPKVIALALDAGYTPLALLMEERQLEGPARDLLPRCEPAPVYTGARDVLASLTGYALTRGVLCAFRRPALPTVEDVCAGARRVAVLEGIVDTTNVGAIFRSAAALHVDGVLLSPTCCDPFNRRAVRVSMGTVFQVPWTYLETQASHWPQAGLDRLHALGFHTVAMALSDQARSIDDPQLLTWEKLAILLGTEGDGLAHATIARLHPHVPRGGLPERGRSQCRGLLAAAAPMTPRKGGPFMDETQTLALLAFFDGRPEEAALARALLRGILSALPETQVQVQKTQITLKHRHVFAALSLPRRSRDRKDHKLTLTLGLAHRLDSPRVDIATEPYPGRWTHHLLVSTPEDLDGQLLAWLQEAYAFAQSKR